MPDTTASFRKPLLLFWAPRLIRLMIRILGLTYRTRWVGLEYIESLRRENKNWIYATWHNNILMDALFLRNQGLVSLVSASTDGRIAAEVLELMGNQTIAGSSSRDGMKGLLTMIKQIRAGQNGAITPDGPRGPRYQLQEGIIYIGQKTGAPLIPIHIEADRQWIFVKSWEQHKLPKPFATVYIKIGSPYHIPAELTKEQFEAIRTDFEAIMMENVRQTINLKEQI